MSDNEQNINVIVSMDFSDEIMQQIRDISPRLQVTQHHPEVPKSAWRDVEVLYTGSNFPEPEEAPLLRWIQTHSAGLDRALEQRVVQAEDVTVTSASGIHARQIANYCLMMMLSFNYKLPKMLFFQRRNEWPKNTFEIFTPVDMHRQTVGIVGYGSIARELARMADAMGMTVLATKRDVMHPAETDGDYKPEGTGDPEGAIPERLYPGEALNTMAAECDYLVVTVQLTENTHHMVNEDTFKAMKDSAVLVNIARGSVVDEKALITALSSNKIGGAALDVFEEEPLPSTSPLWGLDNVVISPHVSGASTNYHEKASELFIANLRRYVDKRPLMNVLNRDEGY